MDTKVIENQLDAIGESLIDKGYERPKGYYQVGEGFAFYEARCMGEAVSNGVFDSNPKSALTELRKWADELEPVDMQAQRLAVEAFGKSIDGLRKAGIDADFVDPLSVALQAMTENLLTDQRTAAE